MTESGKRIGLALSGGGYRGAAYHLGVLRTLNRLGVLDKVDVISSVSGGSIVAAYYALHKA
jgi:NTE family protein